MTKTHAPTPAFAAAGDWVQVHNVVLAPDQRTGRIPADTQAVPFESWVKGFLLNSNAQVGDDVEIKTTCGRVVSGELVAVNPGFAYGFGDAFVPELLYVGPQARAILAEADHA